jgi:hypothetical protein
MEIIHESSKTFTERPHFWITNAEFAATNKKFIAACAHVNLPPTKRQASKFRRKQGTAYKGGGRLDTW